MRWLRRWWWAVLLGLLVVVRIALPAILRSVIESQASQALRARVEVGNVDLALLRGGIALEDVAIRPAGPPDGTEKAPAAAKAPNAKPAAGDEKAAHETAGEQAPGDGEEGAAKEPALIEWKRFAVWLRWLPLFKKTIRLAEVELVSPHVAVDRLQSGDINLAALVPNSETPEPPAATAESAKPDGKKPEDGKPEAENPTVEAEPSGWKFGIDRLVLRRGALNFTDLFMPGSEPLALGLQSIEIENIAIAPDVYGGPADIRFVVKLDKGVVHTRARFTPRKEGIALDVTLGAKELPVHRSRVYVPGVAWSDLTGLLSLAVRYRLETEGRNELSGSVALDDVTVLVAGLDEPALAWKGLAVQLGRVDLAGHDARIDSVRLTGAKVPVRPRDPEPLPVLTAARAAQQARAARQAAAAQAGTPKEGEKPVEPGPPWKWSVGTLGLVDARVRLLGDGGPLDVGVTLDAKNLTGPKHDGSPVKLALAVGDGALGIDGTLRIDPLGFAGNVTSQALSLPELVAVTGALPPNVLQVAKLDADLGVALGSSAPTAGDVKVSGTTAIGDLWIAATDAKDFAAGAKRVALKLDEVTVPGALAKDGGGGRPLRVALGSVDVDTPYARLARTDKGMILPAFSSDAKEAEPAAPAPPPAPEAAGPGMQLTIENLKLARGRIDMTDRTVKPFYWGALSAIDVDMQRVRMPELEIAAFKLRAETHTKGTIEATGVLVPKNGKLDLQVKNLGLMAFNPYVTAASPYSISRGMLFVTTKATIDGPRYDTTTFITLSDFDLASRSGQHVVLEQLGIPITVALALMRDWRGNVDLTIPVQLDEKGTTVGIGTVVTGALVKALIGTIMSPLKIVGAVLPTGGSGAQSLAPSPIRFHAGSSELDDAGAEQVQQLANFLASRPGLGVTLSAPPAVADVRGLREQALLAELGPRKGVIGSIRNVGARGRITDALAVRSRGEEGKLDDDDAKTLDEWLADVPAPSADRLKTLGTTRLDRVETMLRERYGILPEQMARAGESPAEPVEGDPSVRVELGAARR